MLEEEEFWRVFMLFNTGVGNGRERLYGPLSREYERITGVTMEYDREYLHHRLRFTGHRAKPAVTFEVPTSETVRNVHGSGDR